MAVSCILFIYFFEFLSKCLISHRVSELEPLEAKATMSTPDAKVVVRGSSGRGDDLQPSAFLGTEKPSLFSDHPTKNHVHENVSANC